MSNVDNTTLPNAPRGQFQMYVSPVEKEYLRLLRVLIKSITSLVSFINEINNVLLLLREQLQKQESYLSEALGEL